MATIDDPALPPEDAPRLYRARLDADGIYWGVEAVAALAEGDVAVPADCDLMPGHYRWDAQARPVPRFEPLAREARKRAPEAPSMARALAHLIDALAAGGVAIPEYTRAWREWFAGSTDAR